MNTQALTPILDRIKACDQIILFRHRRPDGDCLGASKGLQRILRLSFPGKVIDLPESDTSDYLAFLGPDDPALPDEAYQNALGIVVDTGDAERISNPKYALCRELIKIDHHPDRDAYADLSWVEEHSASCCEMIAAFYTHFQHELRMDQEAAALLYTGIVTDSGRFRYPEVNVAYLHIDAQTQQRFGLSFEDASAAIGYLDSIRGCLCWLAFIDAPDNTIRVRLRSRFVAINTLAERHHGGGHAFASGATVYSKDEIQSLIAETDALVRDYKAEHSDWL